MITFAILATLIVAGAVAAMSLRNLVHCALALTVAFAGLAGIYLQLEAQFVGFAQVLVYVGAVAILIVFAILLTRGADPVTHRIFSSTWGWGLALAVIVFAVMGGAFLSSTALNQKLPPKPEASVRELGAQLMTRYILPLEVAGLLLTVALIGAVLIAMRESDPGNAAGQSAAESPQVPDALAAGGSSAAQGAEALT